MTFYKFKAEMMSTFKPKQYRVAELAASPVAVVDILQYV